MRKETIKSRVTKYIEDGIEPSEVRSIVLAEVTNMMLIDSITESIYNELIVNPELDPYNVNNKTKELAIKD